MKNESIKSIKPNYIAGLKKFTSLIVAKKLNVDDLQYVINKYSIDKTIIKKLFSFICGFPNILIYFNKYLNQMGQSHDLIEFVRTWRHVLSMNDVLDSRKFLYFKSSDCKDDLQMKIVNLLDKYFIEVYNQHYNYNELLFYYNLFLIGKITKEEIYEIDLLINDNKKTIDLPDFSTPENHKRISVSALINKAKKTSGAIEELNNILYKKKLNNCQNCPFAQKDFVPISGNLKSVDDQLDVLIVNLNSNLDDAKNKQIFKEASIVRQNILLFPKNFTWILLNLIPCAFKSKSEIGKDTNEILEQVKNCNSVISSVIDKYIPKFIILIGDEVTTKFIPDIDFNKSIGQLIDNKYLPIFHPNSMRNIKAQQRGKEAWNNIQNILYSVTPVENSNLAAEEEQKKEPEQPVVKVKKKNNKVIKNGNLILLDVKELSDGSILMIYTDEDGNKIYDKKKNVQTSYVKNTSFKECDIITQDVDYEFKMTKSQKFQLIKLLRNKMMELKGS